MCPMLPDTYAQRHATPDRRRRAVQLLDHRTLVVTDVLPVRDQRRRPPSNGDAHSSRHGNRCGGGLPHSAGLRARPTVGDVGVPSAAAPTSNVQAGGGACPSGSAAPVRPFRTDPQHTCRDTATRRPAAHPRTARATSTGQLGARATPPPAPSKHPDPTLIPASTVNRRTRRRQRAQIDDATPWSPTPRRPHRALVCPRPGRRTHPHDLPFTRRGHRVNTRTVTNNPTGAPRAAPSRRAAPARRRHADSARRRQRVLAPSNAGPPMELDQCVRHRPGRRVDALPLPPRDLLETSLVAAYPRHTIERAVPGGHPSSLHPTFSPRTTRRPLQADPALDVRSPTPSASAPGTPPDSAPPPTSTPSTSRSPGSSSRSST